MLRTVLLSVFLPTMMSANQKQPYLYRMPLDPNAKAVPPYTDKLEMYPEKNVIKGRTSNLKDIYLNEYTFTAKPIEPVNAQPVSRAGEIKQKSNKNVPGFIIKSVDLKNNDVIKNEVKKNNETVRQLLNAMRTYLRDKTRPDQTGSRIEGNHNLNSISWTYYDDTMP
ncbi:uncharacterized protein LOC125239361 isoform X4 [Leguminivora glycinivorella]|uniref:uncharacterized protein LOC125239361 isoform X4 n=1 Tax=Leguminivora glycinivorella TaxID=1035111 RepID=UPI00200EC36F|nr:uncharacterized protein LOC125239361 isoform X4 [Leguminivora glycinivorella]